MRAVAMDTAPPRAAAVTLGRDRSMGSGFGPTARVGSVGTKASNG
jgi:hypothetical protein